MRSLLFFSTILIWCGAYSQKVNNAVSMPGTIIVPASDFLDRNPKGNTISDAGALNTDWIFNNTAIVLNSETNLIARISIPQAALYYLYVRSQGNRGAGFKVSVGDKVSAETFGTEVLSWKKAGTFQLKKGITDIKITRIDPSPVVDVLVLSTNPINSISMFSLLRSTKSRLREL